jgi:hypothetical protein
VYRTEAQENVQYLEEKLTRHLGRLLNLNINSKVLGQGAEFCFEVTC